MILLTGVARVLIPVLALAASPQQSKYEEPRAGLIRAPFSTAHRDHTVATYSTERPWFPAYEMLDALGLRIPLSRNGVIFGNWVKRQDGSSVVRLTLTSKPRQELAGSSGIHLLAFELADSRVFAPTRFDLLYNTKGYLIGVFPVLPDSRQIATQLPHDWLEKAKPRYFDLTPFYFDIPRTGDPRAHAKWLSFIKEWERNRSLLDSFLAERYSYVLAHYEDFSHEGAQYNFLQIDRITGAWDSFYFSPKDFVRIRNREVLNHGVSWISFAQIWQRPAPNKYQVVIPRFPTVYQQVNHTADELAYLRGVLKEFNLSRKAKILVVGPGTGVDVWLASFRTELPIYTIGINPLEIANTRATARIAGFKVIAILGDNVTTADGLPRFQGEKFDAVFWNMPFYQKVPDFPQSLSGLAALWDGDLGGVVLKRFARALPRILKKDGIVLVWNYAEFVQGENVVEQILASAGSYDERKGDDPQVFKVRVQDFDIQYEDFMSAGVHRCDGHLYYVSSLETGEEKGSQ
jgi:methylase of polypeptide subunit release factors